MAYKYRRSAIAVTAATIFLFAKSSGWPANEIQDQVAIRSAIESAIAPRFAAMHGVQGEAEVGAIDSRLRLPACGNISVDLPSTNSALVTAKVSCLAPSWTLYVQVRLHAWVDAVVAATNLAPNTRLNSTELTRGRADAFAGNGGLITDPQQAEGKILRAGLIAGSPILTPMLDLPIAVHRGQKVMLTLTDPEMTIKTSATALDDGRVGDTISVENTDSQKTLRATVARDGGVEINF
ncbi:MAG TPA: flagellar basal body P-ring formation chaperone FlgA [Stellaceae bacterium]|jgi:flagella basal body P-ring formation protein FlgA|nr:flagellar basal body P-ring formation chaperone FlgA [Stellaceae bacterium]